MGVTMGKPQNFTDSIAVVLVLQVYCCASTVAKPCHFRSPSHQEDSQCIIELRSSSCQQARSICTEKTHFLQFVGALAFPLQACRMRARTPLVSFSEVVCQDSESTTRALELPSRCTKILEVYYTAFDLTCHAITQKFFLLTLSFFLQDLKSQTTCQLD